MRHEFIRLPNIFLYKKIISKLKITSMACKLVCYSGYPSIERMVQLNILKKSSKKDGRPFLVVELFLLLTSSKFPDRLASKKRS